MAKKSPDPVDKFVGSRIRMRRLMLAMSQGKLADALGLTFQQVQKYEKGANRVGASRMQHIAAILQVPVAFFFEDASNLSRESTVTADVQWQDVQTFMSSRDGVSLAQAFTRIESAKLRREIVALIEELTRFDI